MSENLTEVQRISLALLRSNDSEPVKGKLWFQKELFLLAQNFGELKEESDFEADYMGPYSEIADEELEQLLLNKMVQVEGNRIMLSELGKKVAEEVCDSLDKKSKEIISDLKEFLNDLSQDELLAFIYFSYPDMVEESIKYERLIPKRKELAMKLYNKEKVSLEKAAQIAGVNIEQFLKLLKK